MFCKWVFRETKQNLQESTFVCFHSSLLILHTKKKVASFVTDWGSILLKFRFSSTLGDIFQGVLLQTHYELFSIGINLEPDCIDHINMYYL